MKNTKCRIAIISPNMNGVKGGVNRIQPGHNVGIIAEIFKKQGNEVFFRDTALEGYNNQVINKDGISVSIGESDEQIFSWLFKINPDYLLISVLFSNLASHAWNTAKIAKKANPDCIVIVGGNHVSNAISDYEHYQKNPNSNYRNTIKFLESESIDFAMWGECDEALPHFLNKHANNEDFSESTGLAFFKEGKYYINPKPLPPKNLDDLPLETREIFNVEGYFTVGQFHSSKGDKRVGNVLASRGCPEKCTFCTTPELFGSTVRWRSPLRVYEEIRMLKDKYGVTEIQFDDDTLTANRKWLMDICALMQPLDLRWCTPNGVKVNYYANNPKLQISMFEAMKNSGCYQITFAVESGVQEVLDNIIHKGVDLKVVPITIQRAKDVGMLVHSFYIVGFPGETRENMEQTIKFAAESGSDSFSVAIFSPLPGTPLYREVEENSMWWDPDYRPEQTLFTRSLIKVDGFSSREEFEKWVDEKNLYLNNLLKERDPERFSFKYGMNTSEVQLKKQT